jgi:hypothetical protein
MNHEKLNIISNPALFISLLQLRTKLSAPKLLGTCVNF